MDARAEEALRRDGDRYHRANHDGVGTIADPAFDQILLCHGVSPVRSVLEVGCSTGFRLAKVAAELGAQVAGLEASADAVAEGHSLHPELDIRCGLAPRDLSWWADRQFDIVVVGHLLYLQPREALFALAAAVDTLLADGGHLIVEDFLSPSPISVPYRHDNTLRVFKTDPSAPWTWSPTYQLVSRTVYGIAIDSDPRFSLSSGLASQADPMAWQTLDVVRKLDVGAAYPERPSLPSVHDTDRRAQGGA